jgi:hypothetical protein
VSGVHGKIGHMCADCTRKSVGQWYKCKGCGQPCALLESGAIAHTKPDAMLGVPNSVPCELFRRCESRAFFLEHMAGEPMDPPDSFEPIGRGGSS